MTDRPGCRDGVQSGIFDGVSIHVNGRLQPCVAASMIQV